MIRVAVRKLLGPSRSDYEEQAVLEECQGDKFLDVSECRPRQRVQTSGVLRSVTYQPIRSSGYLEAELYDGTGAVTLLFVGRRSVAGIVPGAHLNVSGVCSMRDGVMVMYNPRYELLPRFSQRR